jgi:hypothetical protein
MRRLSMLALLALALVWPPQAMATLSREGRRTDVSGMLQFVPVFDENGNPYVIETPVGANECLVHILGSYTFTGSLEGAGIAFGRIRAHGPCGLPPYTSAEDGVINGTFSGQVAGRTGTFNYRYTFKLDSGSTWRGRIEILSGTEELEGLRGRLLIDSLDTATQDPYTGWVTFRD